MLARVNLTAWLIGVLLLSAVVGGLDLWGKTPKQTPPHRAESLPVAPANRQPMPVGDIPGWREVFHDDFSGQALDRSKWRVYSGPAGGDPAGWFDPSHVQVAHGMLVLSAYRDPSEHYRWATGGVSNSPGLVQTYGKYLVRFRFDAGVGIGHALLLAAADGSWPPEIDFSENNGGGRDSTLSTLHYGVNDERTSRRIVVNLTQWHTLGVEWMPGTLRYTLDGRIWFTTKRAVPSVPMVLDIQTEAWPCAGTWGRCPNASTPPVVRLYVDWVVAYAPASNVGVVSHSATETQ